MRICLCGYGFTSDVSQCRHCICDSLHSHMHRMKSCLFFPGENQRREEQLQEMLSESGQVNRKLMMKMILIWVLDDYLWYFMRCGSQLHSATVYKKKSPFGARQNNLFFRNQSAKSHCYDYPNGFSIQITVIFCVSAWPSPRKRKENFVHWRN